MRTREIRVPAANWYMKGRGAWSEDMVVGNLASIYRYRKIFSYLPFELIVSSAVRSGIWNV